MTHEKSIALVRGRAVSLRLAIVIGGWRATAAFIHRAEDGDCFRRAARVLPPGCQAETERKRGFDRDGETRIVTLKIVPPDIQDRHIGLELRDLVLHAERHLIAEPPADTGVDHFLLPEPDGARLEYPLEKGRIVRRVGTAERRRFTETHDAQRARY